MVGLSSTKEIKISVSIFSIVKKNTAKNCKNQLKQSLHSTVARSALMYVPSKQPNRVYSPSQLYTPMATETVSLYTVSVDKIERYLLPIRLFPVYGFRPQRVNVQNKIHSLLKTKRQNRNDYKTETVSCVRALLVCDTYCHPLEWLPV